MSRLTRKNKAGNYTYKNGVKQDSKLIFNKLGQLEDIEEELGIDLITLFKLINAENIYSYGHTSIMKNTGQVDIYDKTITIWNGSCHSVYKLSEYGKSFALTKEELLWEENIKDI